MIRSNAIAYGTIGVAASLLLWQMLVELGTLPASSVPPPTDVFPENWRLLGDVDFWNAVADTVWSTVVGLGISIVIALPVGVAIGLSTLAYHSTNFVVEFLKPIPVVALLPLALMIYGTTFQMKISLICFGTVWPLLIQTVYGVRNVDAIAAETAKAYRIARLRRIAFIVLPSSAPFVATGLRVAAVSALVLSVVTELVGGAPGLGYQITRAQQVADRPSMYALIVVMGLLGFALNALFHALERRLLAWHPSQEVEPA